MTSRKSMTSGLIVVAGMTVAACTWTRPVSDQAVAAAGTYDASSFQVDSGGVGEKLAGARVSVEFFTTSKTRPMLGRALMGADYRPNSPATVVISHALWQRRFAGAPTIIGSVIQVNEVPTVIVGIMPAGFAFPTGAELWMPRSQ